MGLFGVGLGLAVGLAATGHGAPVGIIWPVLLLALWLVYRWGRKGSRGSVAVAVATAEATAEATATNHTVVQVFAAGGPTDHRMDALDGVSWRAPIVTQLVDEQAELEQHGYTAADIDGDQGILQ